MNKTEVSNLDSRSLEMFVTVMESESITQAAEKLSIKQSTISHALNKLRTIFDDPLLIRSGRSVTPTPRAVAIFPEAKKLLMQFNLLKQPAKFIPQEVTLNYTIAANDFQCDELLPAFFRRVRPMLNQWQLRVIPSGLPSIDLLRDNKADLIITPYSPDNAEVMATRLFSFHKVCFYDSNVRQPPKNDTDFAVANYILPSFVVDSDPINLAPKNTPAVWLKDRVQLITSDFNSAAQFLRGSDLLTIAPQQLSTTKFKEFASVDWHHQEKPISMFLVWHKKYQKDPQHIWVRKQLIETALTLRA